LGSLEGGFVMKSSLREQLLTAHPQMLGITQPNRAALLAVWRRLGQALEWALNQPFPAVSKKHAAYAMGYADQSVISKFIAGVEKVPVDKLMACLPAVVPYFFMALLRDCPDVDVTTTATMRRTG